MQNKRFKKTLLLIMTLGLLSGCGENSTISTSRSSSDNNEIYGVYETYKANGGSLTYEEWLASIKGDKGDKGDDGMDGKDGTNGIDGKDGSQIYTGEGYPDDSLGKTGDIYIDTETGKLCSKSEDGHWITVGNINGADGKDGKDGETITIVSVLKTSSSGKVDTYTITYSDGTTSSFTVTNGTDGETGAQGQKGEDGHTPTITIGTNGNWFVDGQDTGYTATGPKGDTGSDGTDGKDGVSISKVERTDGDGTQGTYDTYTIYYSDGSTSTFKLYNAKDGSDGHTPTITIGSDGDWYVDGTDTGVTAKGDKGDTGADGKDGVSVSSISKTSTDGNKDTYTIYYSDGTTSTFVVTNGTDGIQGIQGEKGDKGDTGADGKDGVSVSSISKTSTDGSKDTYTIYYSDGTTSTFVVTNGTDGIQGIQGEKGSDGHTPTITIGSDGDWYVDGTDTGVTAKGDKGDKGDTGADGKDGVSVSSISKTSTDGSKDTYTIYYSDGTTSTFVVTNGTDGIQGIQGEKGSDGHTPTITIGSDGDWYVDGTDTGVTAKGDKGDTGADGKDGVSVKNAYVDDNGDLICEMSDGSTINAGKVKDTTKHTVNFYVDDDLVQTVSVSDGSKVSAPSSDVTAGYTVNSWNSKEDGGYKWLFSAYTVTSDLNLYADFTYNDYTVTYVDSKYNTVIDSLSVTYDKSYTLSTIDNQTGWSFSGWKDSHGNSFANFGTYRIASDLTIYASWVANQYTITLDPNNGTVSSTKVAATYDSTYELPTPTRTNYVFLGWYDSNDKKVSSKATWKGTENVTYTAKWTNNQNTYSFDAGDGTCDVDTMVIGWEDAYELPTPTPADGCYFVGWYLNDTLISQSGDSWTYSNIGGTLVAKYTSTYGIYPQTRVSNSALLSSLNTLTTTESNGWYLYNNEYYAKLTAKPDSYVLSTTFDDGTTIVSGTTYWFKCEPITWEILGSNNGEYKLLSTVVLDAHCYYSYSSTSTIRIINGKKINHNNYKYSDIRSWLNNEFYNTAFSLDNSWIQTTKVDNSAPTTNSSTNTYACENTNDKVYLLSYQDYLNADYGFSTSYSTYDSARKCKATDYARANGVRCDNSLNGAYWTRSPNSSNSYSASIVGSVGIFYDDCVRYDFYGVRPSISVKIS